MMREREAGEDKNGGNEDGEDEDETDSDEEGGPLILPAL